ncbi:MAG: SUMF1/EgtB/PvdO family nonheme iron enzyme [Anaerolineae bacterium]
MPDERKLLSILSDQPVDKDRLNFNPYVQTLTEIITEPGTDTPLTIGVFGGWGQGKTSFMRMVQRRLKERTPEEQTAFAVLPIWFNAWLYSREETLWRALVSRVLQAVQAFPKLETAATTELRALEARLYTSHRGDAGQLNLPPDTLPGLEAVSLPTLAGLQLLRRQAERSGEEGTAQRLADVIADVEVSQALTDGVMLLDDVHRHLEAFNREHIVNHGRLVILIDDLDRCLPEETVEVLETIKLVLDVPGIILVLGVDQRTLEESIRARYGQEKLATALDGTRYLEKIVQIPLNLPPIQPAIIEDYVATVTADFLPDPRCRQVFAVGLEPNPRRVKRTFNVFLLLWRLAQNCADLRYVIKPVRLAKIVIIQQYHRDLFDILTQAPHYLIDLERHFRRGATGAGGDMSAGPLEEFLSRSLLHDLLTCTADDEPDANFIDLRSTQVAEYLFLTRSATQRESSLAGEARHPFELQMVTIPDGSFVMGTSPQEVVELLVEYKELRREWVEVEMPQHSIELPIYAISRYPVTVADFARFVEDGGYQARKFWTEAGWRTRVHEGWTQPRYWDDDEYNDPAQPVVGVSWYEAVAYCNWLAAQTGKPYRLPSEAEWEKAARGTDARRYPWGDQQPTAELCNFGENVGRPTPVGQSSPQGDSPHGCADMAGNVWEWTRSLCRSYPYDAADGREDLQVEGARVLRGGAFHNGQEGVRCAFRDWDDPDVRYGNLGFRVIVLD